MREGMIEGKTCSYECGGIGYSFVRSVYRSAVGGYFVFWLGLVSALARMNGFIFR